MGQTIILGLIAGGIYGLFAVGIVLVYRGSSALNFAQGEIGTAALYVAWYLITDRGLPWIIGALGAVAAAAALGWGFEALVVRHMVEANRLSVAVSTIGLLSFIVAIEFRYFGDSQRAVPGPIKGIGTNIAGVFVSPTQMLSLLVTIAVGVGLALFLKRTDFGLGVLAAAQDPTAVRLVGVPLARVSGWVWATGAAISAIAALFIVPTVGGVTPLFASRLFLKGLAAAVVGGLTSLQGAFLGGVVVGLIEAAAKRNLADLGFPSIEFIAVFALLLVVLLVKPGGLLGGLRGARADA
jgi:branched-chain amino acid transport system permease protein